MATAYTMTNVDSSPPYCLGEEYTVRAKYTFGASVVTGDTLTASNLLPDRKVQIVGGRYFGVDADTHASPTATVIIGDGTDTDGYLASKTAGGGEQTQELSFDGALISTNDTPPAGRNVVVTYGGTVATAQSTGDVWVEVKYRCIDGSRVS